MNKVQKPSNSGSKPFGISESLGFRTLSIVRSSKELENAMFRKLHLFTRTSSGEESWTPNLLGPLEGDVKVKVILRPTVSRSVRFGVRHPSGTCDQFFPLLWLFLDSCEFVDVGCLLWREDGPVICSAMTQVQFQVILLPTVCRPVRFGAGDVLILVQTSVCTDFNRIPTHCVQCAYISVQQLFSFAKPLYSKIFPVLDVECGHFSYHSNAFIRIDAEYWPYSLRLRREPVTFTARCLIGCYPLIRKTTH
jgi:hypothetical protein